MKKAGLGLVAGLFVFGNVMSVNAEVPALHMDDVKQTENAEEPDELYQVAENEAFAVELPSGWLFENVDYSISAGKNSIDEMPIMQITPVLIEGEVEDELASWCDLVKEKFEQRLAGEPERVRYEVPGTDRDVEGLKFMVSSEDGMFLYTEFMAMEAIEDAYMSYFCGYISESYDEDQPEDQTTYFEFLHAIDSIVIK